MLIEIRNMDSPLSTRTITAVYRGYDGFGGFLKNRTYTLQISEADGLVTVLHPATQRIWKTVPGSEFRSEWEIGVE